MIFTIYFKFIIKPAIYFKAYNDYYNNYYCRAFTNLTSIADPLPNSFAEYSTLKLAGCTSMEAIPPNLFKYQVKQTDFAYAFYNWKVSDIPQQLFENCIEVTNIKETFIGCSGLTGNIPEKISFCFL